MPLSGDRERMREALVGLAIAEGERDQLRGNVKMK